MKITALFTDFTDADGYPAVMKGVMLPGRCAPFFPSDTVFAYMVGPGVDT